MMRDDRSSIARGFLFADLRGYSAFVERHGDRAGVELLTAYRDVVRRVVPRFSGAEIRTEGDSFYVVFNSPSAALNCGLAILEEARRTTTVSGDAINVGIGVHAGETMELDDAYVGSAVNIAARVCSAAAAGELLTTEAVRSLTRSYLDLTFVAVGRRRFKGISDPVFLYRVLTPGSAPLRRGVVGRGGRLRTGVAVAGLLLVVVGVWALIAVLGRSPIVMNGPGTSSDAPLPSASSGAFPTSDEVRLLGLIADTDQDRCERAPEDKRPVYTATFNDTLGAGRTRQETTVPTSAGIVCNLVGLRTPDELALWTLSSPAVTATEFIHNVAGARAAPRASCASTIPALEPWSLGPLSGQLVCYLDATAVIYWTYDDTEVVGRARRYDGDMEALLAWWEAEARTRVPRS